MDHIQIVKLMVCIAELSRPTASCVKTFK